MGNTNTTESSNVPNGLSSGANRRNDTKIGDEGNEKYFGLENFGNTCYANSVLQALYFCKPFRNHILNYYKTLPQNSEPNLLTSLADLFFQLNNQKKKTGYLGPKAFIQRLRMDNEMFKSLMQQDAQEFLNYILNHFVEILQNELKNQESKINESEDIKKLKTFIHDTFEGTLINETRCIMCENVTSREESFLDLSVDVQQYSSITQCLKNFSGMQILKSNNKFYCDRCCSHQEAQTSMKIKRQPQVLAIQLKRFKYMNNNFKKLSYRVTFPFDFKLPNLSQEETVKTYKLFAAVVHIGSGPNCGHYKCIIRSEEKWFLFDDDRVSTVDEDYVKSTFGFPHDEASSFSGISETCYILFYSSIDKD